MSNTKKKNVTIRLDEEEIMILDELKARKQRLLGVPVSRAHILLECLEAGYLPVCEALSVQAAYLTETSQTV
jgi:hypothetical protein